MHGGRVLAIEKELGRKLLDFSANISPYGMPGAVRDAVLRAVDTMEHYPESGEKLCREIADVHGIPADYIRLGNGAAELLYRLAQCMGEGARAWSVQPTFSEYASAMRSVPGAHYLAYNMKISEQDGRGSISLSEDFLQCLQSGIHIVFLCNPNNPNGALIDPALLEDIVDQCREKGIFLCMDECFLDFVHRGERYSLISELEKNYHLIILRSFTKLYAIPGLRLGYLLTRNQELLHRLDELMPPWQVNGLALAAGHAALKSKINLEELRKLIGIEREYLTQSLLHLDFIPYYSKANFILFREQGDSKLYEYLLERGILIRECSDYGMSEQNYFRIAVRSHEDNQKLVSTLEDYRKE